MKIKALCVLIIFNFSVFSQNWWVWQNPLPQGNYLSSLQILDQNTVVCLSYINVLKSTDFGNTWLLIWTNISQNQKSMYFPDMNIGYILCDSGMVMKSTNAGENWFEITNFHYNFFHKIYFINANTGFIKICDYHLIKFRSKISNSVPDYKNFLNTVFNNNILLPSSSGMNSEKYEILMNLQKTKYKMYEPVIAKFTVINHDTMQMDIYNLFDAHDKSGAALMITSKNGDKWNSNKILIYIDKFYSTPYYVLQPNDTLYVSMPINNWGQKVRMKSYSDNDVYFDQFGYFQPGKYTVYFYFGRAKSEFYGTELKSNDVEFEIVENNKQDLKLLELYKEKKFTEIISKFPNNKFIEHVIAEYIISKGYNSIFRHPQNNYDSLEYNYENFISKYPESYYLLKGKFISPYIYKLSIGISEPNEVRTKIESKLYNETIKNFLNNDALIKNILDGRVYY